MVKSIIVIPARFKSTRLPGKPLKIIKGQTMLYRVWEKASQIFPKKGIFIATDDLRIFNHCNDKGMQCLMTSKNCKTGTDRIAEITSKINADIYINIQGDEPLINKKDILKVLNYAKKNPKTVINCMSKINNELDFKNLNIPKVLLSSKNELLYMSRSSVPGNKKNNFISGYKQVCIYSFPKESLKVYGTNKRKSKLEKIEDIEILRLLEFGYKIKMLQVSSNSIAVDTVHDLIKVRRIIK